MLNRVVPVLTAISLWAAPLAAQAPAPSGEYLREPAPMISGSAFSEAKFVPDRATVRISVQTRATTASAAATENATKQNAVLTSLRSLGIPNDQLSTADYNVSPEYRYEQNKSPVLVGYTVTNSVLADVRDLKLLGKVLDASLSNGANMISSLDFYASNTDAARQKAVGEAVAKARAEADVAARAAGGQLGGLVSLNINGGNPMPRPMAGVQLMSARIADAPPPPTPINPGEQSLTVSVFASWKFVPGH